MSNRRKPRNQRVQARSTIGPEEHPLNGLEPWIWAMQDADEAERRGDAAGALAAIERRLLDPDGRPFWRRSRVCGLRQLMSLGPHLPPWVWSRWILAQALQHLDEVDRGARARRALRTALEVRGGLHGITGCDDEDREAALSDHDWLFRQLHLFELGGLEAFLRTAATPDLVASADRIEEWAMAPMGGYAYVEACGPVLLWHDLAADRPLETINIGSATRLLAGAHVIGRVVPAGSGHLFEGPPLEVPERVARDVAGAPASWLTVLRRASELLRNETITTFHREWRGLVSEVPLDHLTLLLAHRGSQLSDPPESFGAELALAALDLARSELAHQVREGRDDEWDGWAHVHAALADPLVVDALPGLLGEGDVDLLMRIRDDVAEPARSWIQSLVASLWPAA